MDSEELENKIKLMKKRSVHEVHEHFRVPLGYEEVLTQLSDFVAFVQWSHVINLAAVIPLRTAPSNVAGKPVLV